MPGPFRDREDAGRQLAEALAEYAGQENVLVLGLPRGGVPVAYQVAVRLGAPLDVFLVRKLGVPGHEELALGAIASGGIRVLNRDVVRMLSIPDALIETIAAREQEELARREAAYRGGRVPLEVRGRTVIVIDDGLATGASMRAAIMALRSQNPAHIVMAVPTASVDVCRTFEREADAVVCLDTPEPFYAVGGSYVFFDQVSDAEVRALLARAEGMHAQQEGQPKETG
ncbi:MAG: phosphoribosyltransferase [Anaerolineae bacterium]